ncbi:MAG: hypothetical protein EBT45_07240 [Alphaproteobacteria bacterium]|jgi:hypothetical protein|nr:hypothetical protein [Alphaproteobacteria bacterium]
MDCNKAYTPRGEVNLYSVYIDSAIYAQRKSRCLFLPQFPQGPDREVQSMDPPRWGLRKTYILGGGQTVIGTQEE